MAVSTVRRIVCEVPSSVDEFELIRRYFDGAAGASGVVVGVGDDGAVLAPSPGMHLVEVVDTLVEGTHFPRGFHPADIGYRAVAVNLSDIAAMGATPRWMTLALSMPVADEAWLESFAEGLYAAAAEFDVALVGGDTTSAAQIVVSIQVTGEVDHGAALLRSTARPGDTIYVTGTIGDAAAGLAGLLRGDPVRDLVSRFARPSARVAYGRSLVGIASAAIDVSDGLYGDLEKMLLASGVGAEIDLARLPLSSALRDNFTAEEQRRFALSGGDDYELCFTAAVEPPDPGTMRLSAIGTITESPRLVCRQEGAEVAVEDGGYRHFR